MPPTGVSISTCLSWPFCSFFTFTLQAGSSKAARVASPKANPLTAANLVRRIWRPSLGDVRRPFETGAALSDTRNREGQMAGNRHFSEQRLDPCYFRDGRVGKRTHIIFDLGEIARHIRIPHGADGRLFRGM